MKLILDANMPHSAKGIFGKSLKVEHVRDVGLADAADEEILRYSLKEKAVLVTRDLDFANTILHPQETHAGIVVLRVPSHFTASEIRKILSNFWKTIDIKILPNALVIVEPGRYRIRK